MVDVILQFIFTKKNVYPHLSFHTFSTSFLLPSLLVTQAVIFFLFVYMYNTHDHRLTHISMTLIFAHIGTFSDFFKMVLLVVHEHNFKVHDEYKESGAEKVSHLTSVDRTCSLKALDGNIMVFQE